MDTLVSTEDGLRPIEEIQAGDYVWSENTETGKKELKKVLSVSVTETTTLVHVTTENGTVINTTENHPFYVEGKGWCAAAELETGDVLRTEDGEQETVKSVQTEKLDKAVKVYNLEIEGSHTYYVSADRVLVHNACEWNKGSFNTPEDSLKYHYKKHGEEVNATSVEQYLRKAESFKLNLKGTKKKEIDGFIDGVIRYMKNGKYIDLAPDGTVVSYGKI